ncbi:MAG: TetR/AcrR family transcriptional regulator [Alphaproteobacteria bacterium]|nr:TetR/AcrR family transcriptional regulator [Alphaproteobacteria bacterium]
MPRLPDPQLAARRRREILEAALVCFRRRGFHQATMQEICAEARVSPGALYRYFKSKSDIIAAIAAEEHAQIEPLFQSLAAGASLLDTLEILAVDWLKKFADDDAPLIADVFAECVRDRELAAEITRNGMALQDRLVEAVRTAQAGGELAADLDPVSIVRLLFATLDGLGFRVAVLRDITPEAAAAELMTMLRRFLSPTAGVISHPQNDIQRIKRAPRRAASKTSQETSP